MVVGKNFIWLHVPKCGGHAVERALWAATRWRRDIKFDQRFPFHTGWHDSIRERLQADPTLELGGRKIVASFRRLPSWILSRVHYEAARAPHRHATREMICQGLYFEQNGFVGSADSQIERYLADDVHRWIRQEHLAEDFEMAFGDLLPIKSSAISKARKIRNKTEIDYPKRIEFHFTASDLEQLYASNPHWARLEEQLYGELLHV